MFVYFLAAVFLVGGLARIVFILAVGLPHPFFIAMLGVEMVLPVIVAYLQLQIFDRRPTPSDAGFNL